MTIKAVIVMLICVIPTWGGLLYSILRLQKMKGPEEDE